MNKEVALKRLLLLHCDGCNGAIFNCNGCTKEDDIKEILDTTDEEIKEAQERTKKKTKK